jgi:hypothetical protein
MLIPSSASLGTGSLAGSKAGLRVLQGKKMGLYEGNSEWDDVVALAQIAYTDEYAEGIFPSPLIIIDLTNMTE